MLSIRLLAIFTAVCSLMSVATAHVPLGGGENDSLKNAAGIDDPLKSWAIYDDIHKGGEAKYYRLEMKNGQRLHATVFLSESEQLMPNMAVMGPGLVNEGTLPEFVEIPEGYGFVAEKGVLGGREYEPFTPAAYYQICELDMTLNRSGTYYIAVFEPDHFGDFGLAIGYVESFTIEEWLLMPVSVINIHLWEGQSPLIIFAPLVAGVVGVFVAILWARRRGRQIPSTVSFWLGASAASVCIGTASMTGVQMVTALIRTSGPSVAGGFVTVIFLTIQLLIGGLMLWLAFKNRRGPGARVRMAVMGLAGLTFWAGLLLGPVMALVAASLPEKVLRHEVGAAKKAE